MSIRGYDSCLLSGPGGPDDAGRGPSKLVEDVLGLLEDAGVPTEVNDKVVKLIEAWEQSRIEPDPEPEDYGPPPWDVPEEPEIDE